MAMPTRVTARANDQILEIELGLAPVFKIGPSSCHQTWARSLDWAERDALGHKSRWRPRPLVASQKQRLEQQRCKRTL